MVDLIGYWAGVSAIVIIFTLPVWIAFFILLEYFLMKVFEDNKQVNLIMQQLTLNKEMSDVQEEVLFWATLVGLVGLIVMGLNSGLNGIHFSETAINFTHFISDLFSPAVGYLVVIVGLFNGAVYLAKKAVALSRKIHAVSEQLNKEES